MQQRKVQKREGRRKEIGPIDVVENVGWRNAKVLWSFSFQFWSFILFHISLSALIDECIFLIRYLSLIFTPQEVPFSHDYISVVPAACPSYFSCNAIVHQTASSWLLEAWKFLASSTTMTYGENEFFRIFRAKVHENESATDHQHCLELNSLSKFARLLDFFFFFSDELTVDFIFTFKLDQDDPKDKYVNQINFFSIPHKVHFANRVSHSLQKSTDFPFLLA